jgi:biotin synthase
MIVEEHAMSHADPALPRYDWTLDEVERLFDLPFTELVFQAASIHRRWFDPSQIQISRLLSIKTGGCPENCGYCSQSQSFKTGVAASKLMDVAAVLTEAAQAKAGGAQRFCMGAAWRDVKDRDVANLSAMLEGVKAMGLETCMTLGMLEPRQAHALKSAGLDYYNHNLDTGPDYYATVVSTRTYQDRLDTLAAVREAGISTCCGGIVGMGETRRDRAGLLPTACRSTIWSPWKARHWEGHSHSIPWSSCAPLPRRESFARSPSCAWPRAART